MSKIFDALKKTQGGIAAFTLASINNAGSKAASDGQKDFTPSGPSLCGTRKNEGEVKHSAFEIVRFEGPGRIVVYSEPASPAADRFRLLQMRLREFWTAETSKSVLITSPLPGDGKSTVALNLATVLAEERECKVLLVDADLHRGSLNHQLGLSCHAGIAECLRDGLNPTSLIRRVDPLGWYFLSSGMTDVRSPTELLQPQQLSDVMQNLSSHFDWIILDCPPVLALSDVVSLLPHVDGSLLVARAGSTPVKAVEDAVALLGRKHVRGFILNGIETLDQPYSGYYNYRPLK